jgi:hypothetical protein
MRRDGRDVEVERNLTVANVDEVREELLLVDAAYRFVVTAVKPFHDVGAKGASASGKRTEKDSGGHKTWDALRYRIEHIPILLLEGSSPA